MRTAKTDQTGRMPRLICLRWAHMPSFSFCHALADMSICAKPFFLIRLLNAVHSDCYDKLSR